MKGQALVTLIFFMVFATTVTTAAILVIFVNSLSGSRLQDGTVAYQTAQSGADNALIRLLRDPSYVGETLTIGSGSATISVTGSGTSASPYVITSTGNVNDFIKKVQVTATYEDNELSVVSQKEIY